MDRQTDGRTEGQTNTTKYIISLALRLINIHFHTSDACLRGPPGLANGKPEQCHNAPVGPLKAVFTN